MVKKSFGKYIIVLIVVSIFYIACAKTYSSIHTSWGQIYVGMSGDKLSELMGPPQSVGRGSYGCHFAGHFFLSPGTQTVEWAWRDTNGVVVAYLDYGSVSFLGIVPNEKLNK